MKNGGAWLIEESAIGRTLGEIGEKAQSGERLRATGESRLAKIGETITIVVS